jgi:hypothetical protein
MFYGNHFPKCYCIDDIFRKTTIRTLSVQMRNVSFVEMGFSGVTNFIIVRYSTINSRIRNKNRSSFHSVRVTLRLVVYRQLVRLGDTPLETHDQ